MTVQRERARRWRTVTFISAPMHRDAKLQFSKPAARHHSHCTTDPIQVDFLWRGKFADSNVAIKCAPGYVIVDIDPRNGGLESAIALGLLDADGMPTGGAYCERTSGGGWRIIYRLPDGIGRGLKHAELAPGIELFFEANQSLVLVAPSVVDGRPYVALSDELIFTNAPACIVDCATRMQAARAPKPAAPRSIATADAPQDIQSRYMDATLLKVCNELRGTEQGKRYNTLRKVALVIGSKCATTGYNVAEAARQLEEATSHWTNQAKVKTAIATALATGADTPAVIDWKHDTSDTFQQASLIVLDLVQASTWNGKQVCQRGNVLTASVQTVAIAMAKHSVEHQLYGAFAISVRTLRQLTGCCLQTIHNALNALCTDGILSIVGRDKYAFIKANGTDGTTGDKRLQARCYVFNFAAVGQRIAAKVDSNRTVSVQCSKDKDAASYELYLSAPITVLSVSTDEFSRVALGRSAGAVLSKLLAAPNGLDRKALVKLTGLHSRTVKRAIGRLLLHSLVDCDDELSRAVDADALQAALVAVAAQDRLVKRRTERESITLAERTAHSAYVQARCNGIGEANAQRLSRRIYKEIRHPDAYRDKIDADGVIHPANAAPPPAPGDYVNVWEQHAAAAQAKRDAANIPTPNIEKVLAADAIAHLKRVVHRDEKHFRPLDTEAEQMAHAVAAFNDWNAPTPPRQAPPRKARPAPYLQALADVEIALNTAGA